MVSSPKFFWVPEGRMRAMKELARNLRRNQTATEIKLWQSLRKRRFCKFKFRRQHVIGPYIVDFICLKRKLIIEVDGSQHLDNHEYDKERTSFLTLAVNKNSKTIL